MAKRKDRESAMEEASQLPTLPDEIVEKILIYFPVKSLIRFTCVSKRFHSLILHDHEFALSQWHAARDRNQKLFHCIQGTDRFESLETCLFGDPSSTMKIKKSNMFWSNTRPGGRNFDLLGSCNGIVFLRTRLGSDDYAIFYMWNPSIGFVKRLLTPDLPNGYHSEISRYGVGYYKDEYVIFAVMSNYRKLLRYREKGKIPKPWKIDVALYYSSRADTWKTPWISWVPLTTHARGTLVNDAFHWSSYDNKIVAIDLAKVQEGPSIRVREMSMPRIYHDDDGDSKIIYSNVGVIAGEERLSIATWNKKDDECVIQVWIMEEYGVTESWTKSYSFKLFKEIPNESPAWTPIQRYVTTESGTNFGAMFVDCNDFFSFWLVKINLVNEDNKISSSGLCEVLRVDKIQRRINQGISFDMIQYQESLIGL